LFPDYDNALRYLKRIRTEKNRYAREQITLIKKEVEKAIPEIVSRTTNYCLENNINSANDFAAVLQKYQRESDGSDVDIPVQRHIPSNISRKIAEVIPNTSNIIDYERIVMKN
jgi:hypothetical protein